jgi:RNA polymerase sigma-70 factor (family 1)
MKRDHDTDEELMQRVRTHDESALQALLRRYRPRLVDFSCSLLRDRNLADEAVSNVFLSLWRRRESLLIRTNVRSYLFTAVGNQSLNLRKAHATPGVIRLEHAPAGELVDARSADSALIYRELENEISAVLARLPAQRRKVFQLHRMEKLRYKQIGLLLGISERTVQNHMVEAVRQIATEYPRLRRAV